VRFRPLFESMLYLRNQNHFLVESSWSESNC
jgi:hypothetical protein